jgi:DNA polymerase-3 subunit delta
MPLITPAAVRKQIATSSPDPVYLLLGDDDIEKLALANEFENLVEEDIRPFNVDRIRAGEFTGGEKLVSGVASIIAAVRTVPMLSARRVVLVHGADAVLSPKRESEATTRALEGFEGLLKRPEKQTVLVLIPSAPVDKRGRLYKLLVREATLVECGVLESQADAERWVRNRIAAGGARIDQAATRLLADVCGPDVRRLRNDVERLLLYTLGQTTISVEDARQIAGSAALRDDWAMVNAIEAGDRGSALRQLALLLDAGAPPEKVLGQLGWLVRTKFPAFAAGAIGQAIDALFRTDLDLKRSGGDPRVLLERLVVELCGSRR